MKVVAKMSDQKDYSGMAALTICEALLLALTEHEVLPGYEILGILHDAAATHENAASPEADKEMHLAVSKLIKQIIAGENSVRWPRSD